MSEQTRLRATAVVTLILSAPTVAALLRYDIGATTAVIRMAFALGIAMVAVAAVGAVLARVPAPVAEPTDGEAGVDGEGEEPALEPLVAPAFEPAPFDAGSLEEELDRLTAAASTAEADEPFPFLEAEET
jgi:hypothetical protein